MERTRGLSDIGKMQSLKVKSLLMTDEIDYFISSPYERSIQTIKPLADEMKKDIITFEGLRERTIGQISGTSFLIAKQRVYEDFKFHFFEGESSSEAQGRAIQELKYILREYEGKRTVIGTHGDIMTLMMNYFDSQYDYKFWGSTSMPDIYKLQFNGETLINVVRRWV